MPKVSVKEFKRRIADLDTKPAVAKPPRQSAIPAGIRLLALIVVATIAIAALSNGHRTTPETATVTIKADASGSKLGR